jgi:hypothetical protein
MVLDRPSVPFRFTGIISPEKFGNGELERF